MCARASSLLLARTPAPRLHGLRRRGRRRALRALPPGNRDRRARPARRAALRAAACQSAPACSHSTRRREVRYDVLTGPAIEGDGIDRAGVEADGRARRHPVHGRGDGGVRAPDAARSLATEDATRAGITSPSSSGTRSSRSRRSTSTSIRTGSRMRRRSSSRLRAPPTPTTWSSVFGAASRAAGPLQGSCASVRLGRMLALRDQCEQPEPQPPPCASGAASEPSSTVNEWPQPQEAWAFGLSILNPDSSSPERKSIVAPLRYGAL